MAHLKQPAVTGAPRRGRKAVRSYFPPVNFSPNAALISTSRASAYHDATNQSLNNFLQGCIHMGHRSSVTEHHQSSAFVHVPSAGLPSHACLLSPIDIHLLTLLHFHVQQVLADAYLQPELLTICYQILLGCREEPLFT
jgi:hypothetical protein